MIERIKKSSSVEKFLEEYYFYQEEDTDNNIKILTIHSAKGLEFDYVFLPGLTEGNLPHYKSFENEEEVEEERRLFYVGITRAKKGLYISYSKINKYSFNKFENKSNRSRFLKINSKYYIEKKIYF